MSERRTKESGIRELALRRIEQFDELYDHYGDKEMAYNSMRLLALELLERLERPEWGGEADDPAPLQAAL